MNISIFGLGYVGAVSLACLARDGHKVVGVDIDKTKLKLIREGHSPIVEEGMLELMKSVAAGGNVEVTDNIDDAIEKTDISFVCVGTPSSPNGSQSLAAIERVSEQIGQALAKKSDKHVVVIRSTVQPGTVERLIRAVLEKSSGKKSGVDFGLCFQPEFLREGSSIKDYDNPPFTLVGGDADWAIERVKKVFEKLPCEFIGTDIGTAEMLKYACNSFHALKVTFANEIGRIAQSVGVDSHKVMDLVCRDRSLNISPAYMKPGFAFGGSCLPKDLRALLYVAKMNDVEVPMLSGLLPSNQTHIEHAINRVLNSGKRSVGMIGLSFKSGTDDLRESPLVTLAERFIGKGLELAIYDPEVHVSRLIGANKSYIEQHIPHMSSLLSDDLEKVIRDNDVVIVGIRNAKIAETLASSLRKDQLVLDLVNLPNRDSLPAQYSGACW